MSKKDVVCCNFASTFSSGYIKWTIELLNPTEPSKIDSITQMIKLTGSTLNGFHRICNYILCSKRNIKTIHYKKEKITTFTYLKVIKVKMCMLILM